ncbi:hypothetical protein KFL_000520130 [Klebsormidium nitens]|uniref:Pseudouridine synthase RsuA/RluA-like domain-containing protein n=1 Tax=Klebsormidium nitens TaxID=105231 RepID=A0A1Y1HRB5_KLENI|nr:hypothetical protein KFL_000520130 [Klebsormidium nitens]|eukprot:GAQ80342.1 hypothetical protein KFL_000520130 [Klebsormidium nitens]
MNSNPGKAVTSKFSRAAGWEYPPSLFPLPDPTWPARVEHLLVLQEKGTAVDELEQQLDLPPSFAEDLIKFGAVHYAPLLPPPPPNSRPSVHSQWSESTAKASDEFGLHPSSQALKLMMRVGRLQDPFRLLRQGGYLRVHVHPKRFPRCYEVDWRGRVLTETPDYVILDKPAGVPVQGTVDNLVENCAACLLEALGLEEPLKVTHRLDVGTEGCLVLAKTPAFLRSFNQLLADRKVHKTYRALAAARPPLGRLLHWTQPKSYAPRILSDETRDGWLPCELEILAVDEVPWPTGAVGSLRMEDGGWPPQATAYECTVRLITGRTHQVRAQLARVGCPLLGDTMYMPGPAIEHLAGLEPSSSSFDLLGAELSRKVAPLHCCLEDRRIYGAEPGGPLALQAWKLRWDSGTEEYVAGTPWWRT